MEDSHSWLAFSLSQHYPGHLQAFCPDPHQVLGGGGGDDVMPEAPTKLESFLGCFREPLGGYSCAGGASEIVEMDSCTLYGGRYEADLMMTAGSSGFLQSFPVQPSQSVTVAAEPPRKATAESTLGQRTSIYRGVTRHRWTGRYEAHLWDNSCRREGQSRKGRQVYLGGYDKEEKAARAYDLAALKYWGLNATTNLPVSNYEKELEEMKNMTRQEFIVSLRRKSSGFSRGASIYRGVTRHHQQGRWQARIGRVAGNKDLYLGTFSTQEEAAEAYDIAAIKFRGLNAVTNFNMSRYDVESILISDLPVGGLSNKAPSAASEPNSSTLSTSMPPSIDKKHGQDDLLDLHNYHQLQQSDDHQQSGFEMYRSGYTVDFSAAGNGSNDNTQAVVSNNAWGVNAGNDIGVLQKGESCSSSGINPYNGTPIYNGFSLGACDGSDDAGSWGAQPYYFQYANPNVAALHEPFYESL